MALRSSACARAFAALARSFNAAPAARATLSTSAKALAPTSANYSLEDLMAKNKAWAAKTEQKEPGFFTELAKGQAPPVLWIGCADSRVPANTLIGLKPGEVFVHRNVANQFIHSDFNALSVLQYAVDALKVKQVLVVGHYGCGGVAASTGPATNGLVDNWIRHIRDIYLSHADELASFSPAGKLDRLVELNAIRQALNVAQTTVVQAAWARGQQVAVHGLVYALNSGKLIDLKVSMTKPEHVNDLNAKFHKPNGLKNHCGLSCNCGGKGC